MDGVKEERTGGKPRGTAAYLAAPVQNRVLREE
jgi:hypothetical protein